MSLNFSAVIGSQIRQLILNVTKKNFSATSTELRHLIEQYGTDSLLFVLRTLINQIEFRGPRVQTKENQARLQLLAHEFSQISSRPNFASLVCQALESVDVLQSDFVAQFSKQLKLPITQQFVLAVSLAHAVDPAVRKEGINFIKAHLKEVVDSKEKLPMHVLHSFFYLVKSSPDTFGDQTALIEPLRRAYENDAELLMAPLFLTESSLQSVDSRWKFENRGAPADERALVERISTGASDIAELMEDLTPSALNPTQLRDVLEQFPNLKEADVARVIGMMARTQGALADVSAGDVWNVEQFVQMVNEMHPSLSWSKVMQSLDYPTFFVPDARGFATLIAAYSKATSEAFPVDAIMRKWTNVRGQVSFLRQAVQAPPDVFSFAALPHRSVEGAPGSLKGPAANWSSLDLIELLLTLSTTEHYPAIRAIFDIPIKQAPDLLITGIAQLKANWNAMALELCSVLMPMYITGYPTSSSVLHRLWQLNPTIVIRALVQAHGNDPSTLPRLLDIAQDLKALAQILDSRPFAFTIDLASLAGRREYLNLDKWLQEHIHEYKDAFVRACVAFLKEKILGVAKEETPRTGSNIQLSVEVAVVFFKCLLANQSHLSKEVQDELKAVYLSCCKVIPKLDSIGDATANTEVFAPEIENEANTHFQQLFNGHMSIQELVDKLKAYMTSSVQREQKVYACIIRNLFDECRFFHKYPDKELRVSGILFGSLIQHQLIASLWLGIALRYVLDSLKKQPGSKMFKFGMYALEQFKSRLPEWPQYCSHIEKIEHLRQVPQGVEILEIIKHILENRQAGPHPPEQHVPSSMPETTRASHVLTAEQQQEIPRPATTPAAAQAQQPPAAPATAPTPERAAASPAITTPQRAAGAPTSFATSLNIDTLLNHATGPHEAPDEAVADKVHFIFNNLAANNLEAKAKELKSLISEKHFAWLANYVVVRRVSIEANFHNLYQQFFTTLNWPAYNQALLAATYENIFVLLHSDKIRVSTQERTLLKNLGMWLGTITIAKNKPLLSKDIDLKQLILDAYGTGRLIAIIPFVCKVLDACRFSKVLKPPNPWVMGIIALLAELYNQPDLKLNLKFEVVALCKMLGLDVTELKPSALLRPGVDKENNPDWTTSKVEESAAPNATTPAGYQAPAPSGAEGAKVSAGQDPWGLGQLAHLVNIPNTELFAQIPAMKRVVLMAVDRAIREIIAPVVERSVTIACVTTRVIILKDFSLEPDEQRILTAAHAMVRSLAGSLALVTCKEPLRVSLTNHTRSLLQATLSEANQQPAVEQTVQATVQENIDVACMFIENSATDKAVRDIDENLTAVFRMRRAHREKTNQQLFDPSHFTGGRYPANIPEDLRPMPGGLSAAQLRLYEDFAVVRKAEPQQPSSAAAFPQMQHVPHVPTPPSGIQQNVLEKDNLTVQETLDKLKSVIEQLDAAIAAAGSATLATLAGDSEVRQLMGLVQPVLALAQPALRQETAVAFAHRIYSGLFAQGSVLHLEAYIAILEQLRDMLPRLQKDITQWIILAEDDLHKYHREVYPALIRAQLVNVADVDAHLAKLLDGGRNTKCVEFAAYLLRRCVLTEATTTPSEFFNVVEALTKLAQRSKVEGLTKLLDDVRALSTDAGPQKQIGKPRRPEDVDPPGLRQQVIQLFTDWVRICVRATPPQQDKVYAAFLSQLQQQGLLKGDEMSGRFFRILTEYCAERCYLDQQSGQAMYWENCDAFSKLAVLVVKYLAETATVTKINLVTKVLGAVQRVLMRDHDTKGTKFMQKPYQRLLTSLMMDLTAPDPLLDPINFQILNIFCQTFLQVQPLRVPGFAFGWLELVSHRSFMPRLLVTRQKGWPLAQRLLIALLQFEEPFLRGLQIPEPIQMLYKGTLRVLLVLLHDFPEFLCENAFSFCDVIPTPCIQLRNLILSAFPRNMRLPDPFTPHLKVDLLPEIQDAPHISSNYQAAIQNIRADLDNYIRSRQPASFLQELPSRLMLPAAEAQARGTKFNVQAINALVLHVGIQAITQLQSKAPQPPSISHTAIMEIYMQLTNELGAEGRYIFLNAVANHLRFPNSHTHYFSWVLLYLFNETKSDVLREQITRVLLERLIVNRPHPWGLLITFIELIRNPRYNFWAHRFVRCAPEIERLFEHVARNCIGVSGVTMPPRDETTPDALAQG